MSKFSIIESLESRTFLSVAPIFNPVVKADRLVIKAELLRFKVDLFLTSAKVKADLRTMKAAGDSSVPGIATLLATLKTDTASQSTALKEDRLAESSAALADESTIKLDLRQILKDKHDASAEVADHAKLKTDRIQLQTDLITGLDSRVATRQADLAVISTDVGNIVTAITSDTGASSTLVAAATKFEADKTGRLSALTSDLQTIVAARTQLVTDLTASQNI